MGSLQLQAKWEFVLEVNIGRVSELMSTGGSFEIPRRLFQRSVDGPGKVWLGEIILFMRIYGTIII